MMQGIANESSDELSAEEDGFVANMPETEGDKDGDFNPYHNMSPQELKDVRMASDDFTEGQTTQGAKKLIRMRNANDKLAYLANKTEL